MQTFDTHATHPHHPLRMLQDEVPDQEQDAFEDNDAVQETVVVAVHPWMLCECVCVRISNELASWFLGIFLRTNMMVVIRTLGHGLVGRTTIP